MIRRIAFALSLGLGLALGVLWLLGSQDGAALADPGILYVAPGGDCGGATPCYATVQAAVDAASAGDEIRVATGTYIGVSARAGVTQTVYINKTVTIRGGYTTANWTTPDPVTNLTTLDAQRQGRVLYITGDIAPTIEGLRITGGDATGLGGSPWGDDAGGGLYVYRAAASISNCVVYSNTASTASHGCGGGLFLNNSSAMLSGNTVQGNTASTPLFGFGGGLYVCGAMATVNQCVVISNTASMASHGYGGGLFLFHTHAATLSGNTVQGNIASTASDGYGGGLYLEGDAATLSANIVSGNTAYQGGGLYLWDSSPKLTNTVVADNQATGSGSGLYVDHSVGPHLLHTTIVHNSGGDGSGVYVTDDGQGNYSTVALTNTIIVSHTVGIIVADGNMATLNATLWHANDTDYSNNVIHANDYNGDPAFAPDGYHLTAASAAIDKGVDAGVTTDIDDDSRPDGCFFDIGADEFTTGVECRRIYLPLVLRRWEIGKLVDW